MPNGSRTSYLNSHEVNIAVIIPLFIVGLFSIYFGYYASDFFVGIGLDFFGNSIFIHRRSGRVLIKCIYKFD